MNSKSFHPIVYVRGYAVQDNAPNGAAALLQPGSFAAIVPGLMTVVYGPQPSQPPV
ncbi:MAG TPA: hypothetical protein VNH18_33575 [Bryobacteraceae bacterium]|nr:hypothetical protein [Bryobacteraceae bacterium]